MKNLLSFAFISVLLLSCGQQEQLSYYGEPLETNDAVSLGDFLAQMNDQDSIAAKVEAKIVATCPMKGCWMTVDLGNGQEMRVTFKDYGFFVPKEGVEGKKVIFEGVAKKTVTNVDMLRHYAQDAGKPAEEIAAITEPREEISFVATGVAISDGQE